MEFKFFTTRQYFTPEEQKGFDEFLALKVFSGKVVTNRKGETIELGRIDYPEELIVPGQTYYGKELDNGGYSYRTTGTLCDSKAIKISAFDKDNKWLYFDHLEFIEWAKGGLEVGKKKEKPVPEYVKARLDMSKSVSKRTAASKKDLEDKQDGWNPKGKKLSSPKKKKKKE